MRILNMRSVLRASILLGCFVLQAQTSVHAQTLASVQAEPAIAQVGQAVTLTTQLTVDGAINCKVRVHFGDNSATDFKVNQTKDVPLVLTHAYQKAGTYQVRVRGIGFTRCLVADVGTEVKVLVASKSAMVNAAKFACPEGWKLTKAGVSKKTGAFTCSAKKNSPAPAMRPVCPGDLTYFENTKKGVLGCQP